MFNAVQMAWILRVTYWDSYLSFHYKTIVFLNKHFS